MKLLIAPKAAIVETKGSCSRTKGLAVGLQKGTDVCLLCVKIDEPRTSEMMTIMSSNLFGMSRFSLLLGSIQTREIGTPYPDEVVLCFKSPSTFRFYK